MLLPPGKRVEAKVTADPTTKAGGGSSNQLHSLFLLLAIFTHLSPSFYSRATVTTTVRRQLLPLPYYYYYFQLCDDFFLSRLCNQDRAPELCCTTPNNPSYRVRRGCHHRGKSIAFVRAILLLLTDGCGRSFPDSFAIAPISADVVVVQPAELFRVAKRLANSKVRQMKTYNDSSSVTTKNNAGRPNSSCRRLFRQKKHLFVMTNDRSHD